MQKSQKEITRKISYIKRCIRNNPYYLMLPEEEPKGRRDETVAHVDLLVGRMTLYFRQQVRHRNQVVVVDQEEVGYRLRRITIGSGKF